MDPENQDRIKSLVDEHGADDVVVVLGAADLEALEVAAETLTVGDPAYVGSLAGVQLGLPVVQSSKRTSRSRSIRRSTTSRSGCSR